MRKRGLCDIFRLFLMATHVNGKYAIDLHAGKIIMQRPVYFSITSTFDREQKTSLH